MPDEKTLLDNDGEQKLSESGRRTLWSTTVECFCCEPLNPETSGAICYPDGTCVEGTEAEADDTGGTYQGNGTTCAGTDCDGAICPSGGGACYQGTLAEATAAGDTYFGYGVACVDVDCDCDNCGHYVGKELVVDVTKITKEWTRDPNPLININNCFGPPCSTITETWDGTLTLTSAAGICRFIGNVSYVKTGTDCDGVDQGASASIPYVIRIIGDSAADAWSFQASCPDPEHLIYVLEGPSLTTGGEDYPGTPPYETSGIIFETLEPITCSCGELQGSVTANCNQITLTRTAPCQPGYCEEFEQPDALGSSSREIHGTFTVVT